MNNKIVQNIIKFGPAIFMGLIGLASNIGEVKKGDEYKELLKRVAELEEKIK